MSGFQLKRQEKPAEQNDYEISDSCISDFNKLSQHRQIKILKQLNVSSRSFVQYVANEKKALFSDIKQLVDDSKREKEIRESNTKQIERKYGENIRELYADKASIKLIADCLVKVEQIENADSNLKITESMLRAVINNMNIKRADDRKKGQRKPKKKNVRQPKRVMADAEQMDMADSQRQIPMQMTEIEPTDPEQIEIADTEQIEKQIDPEIENVLLDDLGKE